MAKLAFVFKVRWYIMDVPLVCLVSLGQRDPVLTTIVNRLHDIPDPPTAHAQASPSWTNSTN